MQSFEVLEQAYEAKRKKDLLHNTFYAVASLLVILLGIFIYQKYRTFTATQQLNKQNIELKSPKVPTAKITEAPKPVKTNVMQKPAATVKANTKQESVPKIAPETKQGSTQKVVQKKVIQAQNTPKSQAVQAVQEVIQKNQTPNVKPKETIQAKTQNNIANTASLNSQSQASTAIKPQSTIKPKTQKQVKTDNIQEQAFNLNIQTNTKITTKNLIDRFQEKKTYKNAMKVANAFFINKNYKEASDWALRANNLDKYQERSWLLFAKSQVALNKIEVAKVALESFLRMRNSEQILLYYKKISRK